MLAVPDCPNVQLLRDRLAQVLEGRGDVLVSRQAIADENGGGPAGNARLADDPG